jgi:hypothetical protein
MVVEKGNGQLLDFRCSLPRYRVKGRNTGRSVSDTGGGLRLRLRRRDAHHGKVGHGKDGIYYCGFFTMIIPAPRCGGGENCEAGEASAVGGSTGQDEVTWALGVRLPRWEIHPWSGVVLSGAVSHAWPLAKSTKGTQDV